MTEFTEEMLLGSPNPTEDAVTVRDEAEPPSNVQQLAEQLRDLDNDQAQRHDLQDINAKLSSLDGTTTPNFYSRIRRDGYNGKEKPVTSTAATGVVLKDILRNSAGLKAGKLQMSKYDACQVTTLDRKEDKE
ncbi:hypothetical protein Q1695_007899 [Nippostrongylus brasiliensis]|nr:hypothetical protein Q1695_007899 [Nippostrongylus brasiliensis]